jgi:hypothetical protein
MSENNDEDKPSLDQLTDEIQVALFHDKVQQLADFVRGEVDFDEAARVCDKMYHQIASKPIPLGMLALAGLLKTMGNQSPDAREFLATVVLLCSTIEVETSSEKSH